MWVIFKFCIIGIAWHIVCTDAKKGSQHIPSHLWSTLQYSAIFQGLAGIYKTSINKAKYGHKSIAFNFFIKVEYLPIYPSTIATFSSFSVYHLRPHLSIPLTSGSVNQHAPMFHDVSCNSVQDRNLTEGSHMFCLAWLQLWASRRLPDDSCDSGDLGVVSVTSCYIRVH